MLSTFIADLHLLFSTDLSSIHRSTTILIVCWFKLWLYWPS